MGWERTKATTMELSPEPSFTGWLLAGGVAAVVGILLFILHASGMVRALAVFNIWWLASSPVLGWFFMFCLRGWLWGRTVNEHQFLQKEAEYGQQQWEPELLFEVQARHLKLLRIKAGRTESDKARLHTEMESLLAGLIAIDPARAAVLCG